MSNILSDAAKVLETSWCQGAYRTDTDKTGESVRFCSLGALAEVLMNNDMVNDWTVATSMVDDLDELSTLANVIIENYPAEFKNSIYSDAADIVITFNDEVAQSSYEVISMFEKAAARLDEQV
jgi:hypothetical protein